MGTGQSAVEVGGFRVFKVNPGSPAFEAGLEVFFDFIVEIAGQRMDSAEKNFFEQIQGSENTKTRLVVYNIRTHSSREVFVTPKKWGGAGLLGAVVRYDELDNADSQGMRVLEVFAGSPAAQAGLIPYKDFLLGTTEVMFRDMDELAEIVNLCLGKRTQIYVYNTDTESIREVTIVPNPDWGGNGVIGADIRTGILHRIPAPRRLASAVPPASDVLRSLPPQQQLASSQAVASPVPNAGVAPVAVASNTPDTAVHAAPPIPQTVNPQHSQVSVHTLTVAKRTLLPQEVQLGGIWMGPGPAAAGHTDPGADNADATVTAAISGGIIEFDTAPWYGAGGSEERLGVALTKWIQQPGARAITKAGRLVRQPDAKTPCPASFEEQGVDSLFSRCWTNDYTDVGAKTSLKESLGRMRLPSVFGLRIHDPNDNSSRDPAVDEVGIALGASDGMIAEMRRMRERREIQHVSLGMNCNRESHQGVPDEIIRIIRGVPEGTFDSALLAGGWNLLTQAGMAAFLECENHHIDVHVAGVFASGLLVGGTTYAYKTAPPEMVEKAARWRTLAEAHGVSLPAVAIAFAALPKCVSRLVIGMATPDQVRENLAWIAESNQVPAAIWSEARALGLLDPLLPLPSP